MINIEFIANADQTSEHYDTIDMWDCDVVPRIGEQVNLNGTTTVWTVTNVLRLDPENAMIVVEEDERASNLLRLLAAKK